MLVVAGIVPVWGGAAPAQAEPTAATDLEFTVADADTYKLGLDTDDGFTTENTSRLAVTAEFDEEREVQRVSAFVAVFESARNLDCSEDGVEPCLVGLHAVTIDDVATSTEPMDNGDARVSAGPGTDVSVETGHDHGGFQSLTTGIDWGEQEFPAMSGENTNYNVVVSIPKADRLTVDLDFDATGDVTVANSETEEAGLSVWPDDMESAGTHTAVGSAYVGDDGICGQDCGKASVDVPEKPAPANRLYGAMGPTVAGHYVIHNHAGGNFCGDCAGVIPIAFAGNYGAETPETVYNGYVAGTAGTAPPSPVVVVDGPANKADRDYDDGPYEFFVNSYAQVGPGDLVATGFVAPPR